jgi:addiction module RelE/StbE family toxin
MAKFQVLWTEAAAQDLEEIVTYIALDSPAQARRILHKLQQRATDLSTLPERGRIVPELAAVGLKTWRELIMRPWRILYRIAGDRVLVEVVFDSRRDAEALLQRRLKRRK